MSFFLFFVFLQFKEFSVSITFHGRPSFLRDLNDFVTITSFTHTDFSGKWSLNHWDNVWTDPWKKTGKLEILFYNFPEWEFVILTGNWQNSAVCEQHIFECTSEDFSSNFTAVQWYYYEKGVIVKIQNSRNHRFGIESFLLLWLRLIPLEGFSHFTMSHCPAPCLTISETWKVKQGFSENERNLPPGVRVTPITERIWIY